MTAADDVTCERLVELVTAYLEHALSPADSARFEEHLVYCPGCVYYVDQMRRTIALTGTAESPLQPSPEVRESLLRAFVDWRAAAGESGAG